MDDQILDRHILEEAPLPLDLQEYASFSARVFASIVDSVVLVPLGIFIVLNDNYSNSPTINIIFSIIAITYKPFFEYKYGGTLGKMALGIKVVTHDLKRLSLPHSIFRNILYILSGLIGIYDTIQFYNHPTIDPAIDDNYATLRGTFHETNGYILDSIIFICALFVLFTAKKQTLYDIFSNTYCIVDEKSRR